MLNKVEYIVLEKYKMNTRGNWKLLLSQLDAEIRKQELNNYISSENSGNLTILKEIRRKVRETVKQSNSERGVYYIIAVVILATLSILFHQAMIGKNIYNQLTNIQVELIAINGQVRDMRVDNEPLLYFLEEVNKYQKLLEEGE